MVVVVVVVVGGVGVNFGEGEKGGAERGGGAHYESSCASNDFPGYYISLKISFFTRVVLFCIVFYFLAELEFFTSLCNASRNFMKMSLQRPVSSR